MMPRENNKILILGASGFLGSAQARHMQKAGKSVHVLQHRTPLPADISPHRVYTGSLLNFDWKKLQDAPPQVIYHFARIPGPGRYGRAAAAWLSALANRRLLRWLSGQSHPPLLVLAAGTLAYGTVLGREITEDEPLQPASFARQYHIGEKPIVNAAIQKKIPIQIIRVPWVYANASWCKNFYLRPMAEKKYIPLYGNGDNFMSLLHVEDAAGMIDYLARNGLSGLTFNLFCGPAITQREFIAKLQELSGLEIREVPLKGMQKTIAEAFRFSLRVGSKYGELYQAYPFIYPDLRLGLESIIKSSKA